MKDVRLKRLTQLLHRRAGEILSYELKDPRMGFVTVSRVKLSGDLRHAVIYWSIVGTESERSRTAHALEDARGHVQSQIAAVMHTRVTPVIRFEFDESIAGSVRVSQILDELRGERAEPEETPGETPGETPSED
jgi:ribosome-binding factor A